MNLQFCILQYTRGDGCCWTSVSLFFLLRNWTRPDTRRFALEVSISFIIPSRHPTLSRIWTWFSSLHIAHSVCQAHCAGPFSVFVSVLLPTFRYFIFSTSQLLCCISSYPCFQQTVCFQNWLNLYVRLRAGRSGVRIPARARDFTLLQDVHIGSGAHLVC